MNEYDKANYALLERIISGITNPSLNTRQKIEAGGKFLSAILLVADKYNSFTPTEVQDIIDMMDKKHEGQMAFDMPEPDAPVEDHIYFDYLEEISDILEMELK
jgi:hypothetical protein